MTMLTLNDVAVLLKRCPHNATVWLKEKNIPYVLIGKSRRWERDDVLQVIESEKIRPSSSSHLPRKTKRHNPITGKSNTDVLQSMGY